MTIYLLVKRHNKTGLRYLCKTIKKDYHKYRGSGYTWKEHLREYGEDYSTLLIRECSNQEDLYYWGSYYSRLWRITTAVDDFGYRIWANRIPETGGGALYGDSNPSKREDVKILKSLKTKGKKREVAAKEAIAESWKIPERRIKQTLATSGINHYSKRNEYKSKLLGSKRPGTGLAGDSNPAKRPEIREKMRGKRGPNIKIAGDNHYTRQSDYQSKISGDNHYTKDPSFKVKSTNKNYDHVIYTWFHSETNKTIRATRREFIAQTESSPSSVCKLVKQKANCYKGWTIIDRSSD